MKNLTTDLKKVIDNLHFRKDIILEISLFGSYVERFQHESSDIDIFVLHSAKSSEDYKYIFSFVSKLNKSISSKQKICDIFICHKKSLSFISKYLFPYLENSLRNRVVFYPKSTSEKVLKLKTKDEKEILKANAFMSFLETFSNSPTILHEERRKNMKNIIWTERLLSQFHNDLKSRKNIKKRLNLIDKEDPLETIKKDLIFLQDLFRISFRAEILNLDLKTLARVQLASYYLIFLKRNRPSSLTSKRDFIVSMQKGVSLLIENTILNKNLKLTTECKEQIQYLIIGYLDDNGKNIKDIKKDYLLLLKTVDDFLWNLHT